MIITRKLYRVPMVKEKNGAPGTTAPFRGRAFHEKSRGERELIVRRGSSVRCLFFRRGTAACIAFFAFLRPRQFVPRFYLILPEARSRRSRRSTRASISALTSAISRA